MRMSSVKELLDFRNAGRQSFGDKKGIVYNYPRYRGVAQLASARALGARGRRFKSSHPDHPL